MTLDPEYLVGFRPRMMSVAYRMLGSVMDAEDVVQDAFMRIHTAGSVTSPEGFLIRTTTRLCIDRMRANQRRREEYIGPWVPEPVHTKTGAQNAACRAGDVNLVEQMLTEDVEVHSDGGGKASAARTVIRGRDRSARFLAGVFSKKYRNLEMHSTTVNGEPGALFTSDGVVIQIVSLCIDGGVRAIYMTNNPDKLSRWSVAEVD
jgi:hypothetical protein